MGSYLLVEVRYDVNVTPYVETRTVVGSCRPASNWNPVSGQSLSITETWQTPADPPPMDINPWEDYPNLDWNSACNTKWQAMGYQLI